MDFTPLYLSVCVAKDYLSAKRLVGNKAKFAKFSNMNELV
jgi:hypothetical protein